MTEPIRITLRMPVDVQPDVRKANPFPFSGFVWIGIRKSVKFTYQDMVEFIFNEAILERNAINEVTYLPQSRIKAHFLAQPASSCLLDRFARARMSTAGVGPEPFRVILRGRSPLQ